MELRMDQQIGSKRSHSGMFLLTLILIMSVEFFWLSTQPIVHAATVAGTISITGESQPPGFRPSLVTIHAGDAVMFINMATPAASYVIIADNHSFTSPPLSEGQQWVVVLKTPGVYEYHSPGTSPMMVGEIVVVPSAVYLFPAAAPAAQATAFASLQQGRKPGLTFATTSTNHEHMNRSYLTILLIVLLVLLGLSGMSFLCYRLLHPGQSRQASLKHER
jgi:plastocyanin